MASAGTRVYFGGLGLCPQRVPGAEPLVEDQGNEAPLKLKTILHCEDKFSQKLAPIFRLAVGEN